MLPLAEAGLLTAAAHITGGGIPDNLPRVLPAGVRAEIYPDLRTEPPVFGLVCAVGRVPEDEIRRTFNLGMGMILVVGEEQLDEVFAALPSDCPGRVIGGVTARRGVRFLGGRKDS